MPMGYVLLAIALTCNALANFLLKIGACDFAAATAGGLVQGVLADRALLGGLALFALNIVFYTLALAKVPLSTGYPLMAAGSLIFVTALSALYLRESIGLFQVVGISCIMVGIVLVVQR